MGKVFYPFDVLLPKEDFDKWAAIACDQYTSDKDYWESVKENVNGKPSALNIMVPEAYLNDEDITVRISNVDNAMKDYLENAVFNEFKNSMVYVERIQTNGKLRKGIVGVIDLEDYEYKNNSECLVRPTEDVVVSRIPPRLKVRENALLEMSHVLLLIADKDKKIVEGFSKDNLQKLYDFKLYPNGENIKGFLLQNEEVEKVQQGLHDIVKDNIMFLVGDGNHSIATAKESYEKNKENKLARYTMVEVINLFDESLIFEPIHRIIYNTNPAKLLDELIAYYPGTTKEKKIGHNIEFHCSEGKIDLTIPYKYNSLAVGALQKFLDYYLAKETCEIDYIHDPKDIKSWSMKSGNAGFVLPEIDIDSLFAYVKTEGRLPRKTFSIGNQEDKRYYIECRKIK